MLRWAISYVLNRLFFAAVLCFGIGSYFRSSCGGSLSILEQVARASEGLNAISRIFH
jgi:hypothetical protein